MSQQNEKKQDQLVNTIAVPSGVSEKQARLAKAFVKAKMLEGFTVSNFCSENNISSKSWYEWMEKPEFKRYLNEVSSAVIPDDEREAFQALKKHLLKIPYMQSPTPKQIEMFLSVFEYVQEADKVDRMKALGIDNQQTSNITGQSLEDRKRILLSRLMDKPKGREVEENDE